jgi:AraC-like DNA-binding protein
MSDSLSSNPDQRVDDLAENLNVSPEHAARVFRKHTGLTPSAFRSEHRLQRALRDLRSGLRALDVVHRWGFSDQSHLCRTIKTATSKTVGDLQRSDSFNTQDVAS